MERRGGEESHRRLCPWDRIIVRAFQRGFRVWLSGPLLDHRGDGFRGRFGLCIYSRRKADGSLETTYAQLRFTEFAEGVRHYSRLIELT